jgi:periplasmic divalent cation tolerance protein
MYIVVFTTCANKEEAQKISRALVEKRLAACVNILPQVESLFWWEGKVDSAQEFLLVIKSRAERFGKICALVKSLHSYEVPEIISLPVSEGHQPYLQWIDESLG